jgi:hypothetical protein
MTFDPDKVPGGDVRAWGADCRAKALAGLEARDWRSVYDWTKTWIGWGGGAWLPDCWMLYAASALLQGQPKNAVHSLDLGLGTWIEGPIDRTVLAWCRGQVVRRRLSDPKTALLDMEDAVLSLPGWLADGARAELLACREESVASRKRVPSVKPRPDFAGPEGYRHVVAPPVIARNDGDMPDCWPLLRPFFEGPS